MQNKFENLIDFKSPASRYSEKIACGRLPQSPNITCLLFTISSSDSSVTSVANQYRPRQYWMVEYTFDEHTAIVIVYGEGVRNGRDTTVTCPKGLPQK